MVIYTSRINYQGPGRLDVSVKSGDKVFAPTWDIVMGVKQGKITVGQYTTQYYALMRDSWFKNQARWLELIKQDVVVLCCYCAAGEFCHRHLLADMLIKICQKFGIPVEYRGEI